MGISGGGGRGPNGASRDVNVKQREIGERIRRLRTVKLRLDQAGLASELGVSHGTVSYWERGGNQQPANLRRLAEYAGVTIEWLTNGVEAGGRPELKQLYDRMAMLEEDHLELYLRVFNEMLDFREGLISERLNNKKKP
jgi:transcriptional regulator with XRE-family HTH domain